MILIDIEAAFLNAEFESDKPIYAEWPEGIVELGFITEEERKENCIHLVLPMYGGVDVPRLFMKSQRKYLIEKMHQKMCFDHLIIFW